MRLSLIPIQRKVQTYFYIYELNNKRMIIAPKQKSPFFTLISLVAFVIVVAHTLLTVRDKR